MIFDDFQDELMFRLGGNLIDVELTELDYHMAFKIAKRTFIQRGNNNLDRKFISLDVVSGTTVYVIPTGENVDTIVKIIKPASALNTDDPFAISQWQLMMDSFRQSVSLASYELMQQSIESLDLYMAKSAQFIWKKRNNELTLLEPPVVDETWLVEVYADMADDEYRDMIWIQNFSLAEAKIILGRAYSKFQSITTPTGETALNGDQLIQEGVAEKEFLLENIKDFVDGDPAGGIIVIG